jgi:hypothetical protein
MLGRVHPARRRLTVLSAAIAVIAAVLAMLLPATPASVQTAPAAGTRVGASHPVAILSAGVSHAVSAGGSRCGLVSQARFTAGACVAAEENAAGIRDVVNPLGATNNCAYCAVATDRTLAGSPASALDIPPGAKGMPISVVSDALGGTWKPVSGIDEVEQELTDAGDGARGVVYGGRPAGQIGHVWNVINRGGTIQYVDGQTGLVPNFGRYSYFQFLRTN